MRLCDFGVFATRFSDRRKVSSAMTDRTVSYGELYQLLAGLHFIDVSNKRRWRAYRQADTEVVILLANREPDLPARRADLVSVRRHLDAKGLMDAQAFERRFPQSTETEVRP
jgi:hypothetical protein